MEPESECPFCLGADDELAFVVVPKTKRRPGHRLVVPRRHVSSVLDLSAQELKAMMERAAEVAHGRDVQLRANVGWRAGQRVEHAHLHVIPR